MINMGCIYRFYGYTDFKEEHLDRVILNSCIIIFIVPVFMYFSQVLNILDTKSVIEANKAKVQNKNVMQV
jgi:hypothetical protein